MKVLSHPFESSRTKLGASGLVLAILQDVSMKQKMKLDELLTQQYLVVWKMLQLDMDSEMSKLFGQPTTLWSTLLE